MRKWIPNNTWFTVNIGLNPDGTTDQVLLGAIFPRWVLNVIESCPLEYAVILNTIFMAEIDLEQYSQILLIN